MKSIADTYRRDVIFEVGDMVFVKLRPNRQLSLTHSQHKLSKRFYGPCKVRRRIGLCAYEIELLPFSKIHNVFHVSCLKKAFGYW